MPLASKLCIPYRKERSDDMKEIKAIIQPFKVTEVVDALREMEGLPGLTVSDVRGFGRTPADAAAPFGAAGLGTVSKAKLEIMVPDEWVEAVVGTIQRHAHTGNPGDGRIFIIPIEESISIRTGERGLAATPQASPRGGGPDDEG
jgi:nitrogen regulatory protein P-II 1